VGRLWERLLAGDRPERGIADLDDHGPRLEPRLAESSGDSVGHREQGSLDHIAIARVDVEGVLVADGLGRVAIYHGIRVASPGTSRQRSAVLPETPLEERRLEAGEVADRRHPE